MILIKTINGEEYEVKLADSLATLMLRNHPEYRVKEVQEIETETIVGGITENEPKKRGRKPNGNLNPDRI